MPTTSAVHWLGWSRLRPGTEATEPADHGAELALDMVYARGVAAPVAAAYAMPAARPGWWKRVMPGRGARPSQA